MCALTWAGLHGVESTVLFYSEVVSVTIDLYICASFLKPELILALAMTHLAWLLALSCPSGSSS